MNIPKQWLEEYIKIDDLARLEKDLTMSGTKVEAIHAMGAELTGIITGKIIDIKPHPNAEKLCITTVDTGGQTYQIVTGATNVYIDALVPVALPGAVLAGGKKIEATSLRGEDSHGMLCSIEELGWTMADFPEAQEDGIYIFPGDQGITLGEDVCQILSLKEDVLELELTTNRPDCNSIIGIARECAALQPHNIRPGFSPDTAHTHQPGGEKNHDDINRLVSVSIENPQLCRRYVARVVTNVKVEPSPQWMRRRLSLAGIRPRNNIVDITNYVMMELGQPLHAFDSGKVTNGEIIIRNAKEGEEITTLDGNQYKLTPANLLITDPSKPIALAGVMGGENSSISNDTTTVIFESANFNGYNIRQTSLGLGLRTDSSHRYGKGLDPNLSLLAVNRCMELVEKLNCGTVVKGWIDVYPTVIAGHQVAYTAQGINKLLGTSIPKEEIISIFARLGLQATETTVEIPTIRKDIESQADLAEEIIRIYGFENLPYTLDSISSVGRKTKNQIVEELVKATGKALGLSEIFTYSFENPKQLDKLNIPLNHPLRDTLKINNPQGDYNIMKTTTLGGMMDALSLNYNRRNLSAALFEVSKIYKKGPQERLTLTLGMYHKNADFFYIKGIIEEIFKACKIKGVEYTATKEHSFLHPGRGANLTLNGENIGYVGEAHPSICENYEINERVYLATLDMEIITTHAALVTGFTALPKHPAISRDIAMIVKDEVTVGQIQKIIISNGGTLLENTKLFDVYKGQQIEEGHKSIAFNLVFRDREKTLEDKTISPIMTEIVGKLRGELKAVIRDN